MSKHTPGPFRKELYVLDGDSGSEFVVTAGDKLVAAEIANEADADLFVAAPKMLKALELAQAYIEDGAPHSALRVIKAAIAEGRDK